MTTNRCLKCKQ